MIQIPYGLRKDEIVHISEVESGLSCNVFCIDCNSPLEAHKGKTLHYFKHKNNQANCNVSLESYLHLIAKEIILKNKKIAMPAVYLGEELLFPAVLLNVSKVLSEKKVSEIRPDLICIIGGETLLIEIKVTNGVNNDKLRKIEKLAIDTIEISLSKKNIYENPEIIEYLIINSIYNKEWIYNRHTFDYLECIVLKKVYTFWLIILSQVYTFFLILNSLYIC